MPIGLPGPEAPVSAGLPMGLIPSFTDASRSVVVWRLLLGAVWAAPIWGCDVRPIQGWAVGRYREACESVGRLGSCEEALWGVGLVLLNGEAAAGSINTVLEAPLCSLTPF